MLSVVFDHEQKRTAFDRIGLLASGLDLDGEFWSNAWIDPVTNTLTLLPPPLTAAWFTSKTGLNAKWATVDYTLTTPTKWKEIERHASAGPWLLSQDVNEIVRTTAPLAKNQGVYLAFLSYGSGDNFVQMECGWADTGGGSVGVSFRIWSGGEIEFWHDGLLIEVQKISGGRTRQSSQNLAIEMMFIPGRRREILLWSSRGDGHSFVLPWLEEDDPDPTITDAAKFWWYVPTGKADVQAAKITYPTSGYATSLRYQMSEPPVLSDVFEKWDNELWAGGADRDYKIVGNEPYVGSVSAFASLVDPDDGATPFVPDGTKKECRVRVDLTSDGTSTPFVYAAQIGYRRVIDLTSDTEVDATSYVLEASLSVPDSPSDVSLDLLIRKPFTLEALVPKLTVISNRPVVARLLASPTPIDILDGFSEPPSWVESILDGGVRYGQELSMSVRDRWKSLENYMFRERVVLDGMTLEDALAFVLQRVGLEAADRDLEATGVTLGAVAPLVCSDSNVQIEIGDTAAEWVQNIAEDYAAGFFYGFVPTASGVKFVFKSETALGSVPEGTLYESVADALVAFPGEHGGKIWARLYHSYTETRLEPLANDVRVTGQDPRTKGAYQTYKPDAASQDPTLPPASRPDNWLGEKRMRGLIDPAITTQALANDVTEFLFDKVTPVKKIAEWRSTLLIRSDGAPVWRGQVVRLDGKGDFRVRSIEATFLLEDDAGGSLPAIRECVYTGEWIGA